MEIVVMLLTVAVCILVAIGFVLVLLLQSVASIGLYLIEWRKEFDAMFVLADEYDGDDSEEEEIEQWK